MRCNTNEHGSNGLVPSIASLPSVTPSSSESGSNGLVVVVGVWG
ncbi:MAG: hypothetical protein R2779_06775 [Crocinitomicaceae bacterium]